jgi:IPT/TIG domain-containing protein
MSFIKVYRFFAVVLFFYILPGTFGVESVNGDKYGEVTATLSELQTLTQQMDIVYLDIGYYVSIENLNDLLSDSTTYDFDNIDQFDGTWVISTGTGKFNPEKVDLKSPYRLWQGPYVNFNSNRVSIDGDGYDKGTLLDFWGCPYYLFSPLGFVRTDEHIITQELYGDYFDLYAIVSLGPDGIKSSDDLYRTFGTLPTSLVISSLSSSSAYPGDMLTLRGYNMGSDTRAALELFFNETPITDIISKSSTLVEFLVPQILGSGNIKVKIGEDESNTISLEILEKPTSSKNWILYE